MDRIASKLKFLIGFLFLGPFFGLSAVEPGEVIINELYFFQSPKGAEKNHFQAVELLVVADKLNLNGLQVTDRPIWNVPKNGQCTLQDAGSGFLDSVPKGTLVVIYNGHGTDDTNANDFVLTFYAKSSLFCNVAPTGNAFGFRQQGHALHVLHLGRQVDFVKYRASDAKHHAPAEPGKLGWENGIDGHVPVGRTDENVGIRFIGNKPLMNDYPVAWMPYPETYKTENNLGEPNGSRNTEWINSLRAKTSRP